MGGGGVLTDAGDDEEDGVSDGSITTGLDGEGMDVVFVD